jgi:hypothetical protein
MGAPDRHFRVVLRAKQVAFSPKHHLHPVYYKEQANPKWISPCIKFSETCPVINGNTSWEEAFILTKEAWKAHGMGGKELGFVTVSPQRATRETTLDPCRKLSYEIQEYVKEDPSLCDGFE